MNRATWEQLFNWYPPPLVKLFEQQKAPIEIDITNDIEPVKGTNFVAPK